jgi:hypothetical protein
MEVRGQIHTLENYPRSRLVEGEMRCRTGNDMGEQEIEFSVIKFEACHYTHLASSVLDITNE